MVEVLSGGPGGGAPTDRLPRVDRVTHVTYEPAVTGVSRQANGIPVPTANVAEPVPERGEERDDAPVNALVRGMRARVAAPAGAGRAGRRLGDVAPGWHARGVRKKDGTGNGVGKRVGVGPSGEDGGQAGDGPTRRELRSAAEAEAVAELESLVEGWLAVPDAASLQGVPLGVVRRQLQDRELLAVRRGENRALYIPAAFVTADGPRPEMRGTFTVLADAGMSDLELLTWLFRPDPSFLGGSAMASILAGHKTEVRRRAMEEAF